MNIQTKHIVPIVVIATLLNVAISYYFFSNKSDISSSYTLGRAHSETIENWDFYKHFPIILEATDPEFVEELEKQFEDEEDGSFMQLMYASLLFEANQTEPLRDAIKKRFTDYQEGRRTLSGLDSNELFQKNTACSNLAADITKGLKEKEEFEFIFYSPVLNECVYSISKTTDATKGYRDFKVLFSGTTRKEIGSYLAYVSYNYEDILGRKRDEQEGQVKTDKQKYLDFVLTNSLYNFDLLKGVSHIGDSL